MKRGIASALIIAVVLIGGASWYRFADSSSSAGLVATDQRPISEAQYEELLKTFLNTEESSPNLESLTTTDLIGRQMIIDYIGLARDGSASEMNIINLADEYAESLTTISQAPRISSQDITITSNSRAELESYAEKMNEIYAQNNTSISQKAIGQGVSQVLTEKNYQFLSEISKIYSQKAEKLKAITTPTKIIEEQILLINNNLSNSWALESLSKIEDDPAAGLAGLILISQNLDEEIVILGKINTLLGQSGL